MSQDRLLNKRWTQCSEPVTYDYTATSSPEKCSQNPLLGRFLF